MKNITYYKQHTSIEWQSYRLVIKSVILSAFMLAGIMASLQAQETQYTRPSIWFGAAGGANFNFYRGSTQQLNSAFTAPVAFHQGDGVGLYLAPLLEVYNPGSMLGIMLQVGYDNRNGSFQQEITPCNCPADLKTKLGLQ